MMTENEARKLGVSTEWNGRANVCVHCGKVPETFYVATGHDHTDYDIRWCPCREPNHNWCAGCSPDNCSGCGAAPVAYTTPQPDRTAELEQLRQRVAELEEENTALVKTIQRDALTSLRRLAEQAADVVEFQSCITAIGNAATGYDWNGGLAEYVADAFKRLAIFKVENEWQPIETAPKDGTVVIVWWWNKVITAWCAGAGLSRDGGDWWRSHAMEVVSTDYPRPTHWMPLPKAPDGASS